MKRITLSAVLMLAPLAAAAADYPTRPITLIVPYTPAGATDIHIRALAAEAEKRLGQPIVIENKPGASGTLGPASMAATAKPDGYTISHTPTTLFRMPAMQKVAYDPVKDFTYIIVVGGYTNTVGVNATSPFKTWADLIAYAKANPGKVTYSVPGAGSSLHLNMEQIGLANGVKWTMVPFRGEAEQVSALLGDHTTAMAGTTGFFPQVDAGNIRLLVTFNKSRLPRYPDVPTLREVGTPMDAESPYGLVGPKGLDPKIVKILHDAFREAMQQPSVREVLRKMEQPEIYMDSEGYRKFAVSQVKEQAELVERLGLAKK